MWNVNCELLRRFLPFISTSMDLALSRLDCALLSTSLTAARATRFSATSRASAAWCLVSSSCAPAMACCLPVDSFARTWGEGMTKNRFIN